MSTAVLGLCVTAHGAVRDAGPFRSGTAAVQVSVLSGHRGEQDFQPVLALGPPGRELVAYAGANAVLARRLDYAGRPAGPQVRVARGSVFGRPAIVWLARRRRFLVAWSSTNTRAGPIVVRAVSAGGRPVGPARTVTPSAGVPSDPRLVVTGNDTVLLAWAEICGSCRDTTVGVIRDEPLDASGRLLGRSFIVARSAGLTVPDTVLRLGPDRFAVLGTTSFDPNPRAGGIFARTVDAGGRPARRIRLVRGELFGHSSFARAAAGGGYLASWAPDGTDQLLELRRFSVTLRPLGGVLKLVDYGPGDGLVTPGPIVCSRWHARCLATWTASLADDAAAAPPPSTVQGAELDLNGASTRIGTKGPLADVSANPSAGASAPALVALSRGRVLLAWVGSSGRTGDSEVFTRVLSAPE